MSTSDVPTEEQAGEPSIRYVLFVCNHNAGRSQMAQAFFERYGPEDVRASSPAPNPRRRFGRPWSRRCARSALTSPGASRRS